MAEDVEGRSAEAELEVTVVPRPSGAAVPSPSVLFQLTLDHNYRAFARKPLLRVRLARAIGRLFGDSSGDAVHIESIESGSTVVTWSNATLPTDSCDEREVQRLRETLVDDTGAVTSA